MKELAVPSDRLRYSLLPLAIVLSTRLIDPYHDSIILHRIGQLVELMGAMTFRTNSGSSLVLRPKTGLVKNMAMMEGITINMNSQIPIIESYLIGKITTCLLYTSDAADE